MFNECVYDVSRRKRNQLPSFGAEVYSFGLPEAAGHYVIRDKESRLSEKVIKTEL